MVGYVVKGRVNGDAFLVTKVEELKMVCCELGQISNAVTRQQTN